MSWEFITYVITLVLMIWGWWEVCRETEAHGETKRLRDHLRSELKSHFENQEALYQEKERIWSRGKRIETERDELAKELDQLRKELEELKTLNKANEMPAERENETNTKRTDK